MREIDEKAMEASKNRDTLNLFVLEYEAYILKCASKTAKRFLTKSDDEWSVALEAFCNAVETYSFDRGSFLSFAEMVINRRLIDFFRKQSRFKPEFPVNPSLFSGETEENEADLPLAAEIVSKTKETPDNSLKEEIEAVTKELFQYGFSFYDLIGCSPKSRKTRECCARAVNFMALSPILVVEMRKTSNLPLKTIESNTKVPRKILERHRKYIIAAVEIITGDYPCLAEYMQSFGKEQRK